MMKVNGQFILLEVDTGSPGLILFEGQVEKKLQLKKGSKTRLVQHVAGRTTLQEIFLTNASLGTTYWPELSAYLLDTGSSKVSSVAGLLGFSRMSVKRVHFDFKNSILSWNR
jgi:hypothetical protein